MTEQQFWIGFWVYILALWPVFVLFFIHDHRKHFDIKLSDLFMVIIVSFIPFLRECILISIIDSIVIKKYRDDNEQ